MGSVGTKTQSALPVTRQRHPRILWWSVTAALLLALQSGEALAASSVTLTVSPGSVSFPDADPDLVPLIPANSVVTIDVRVTGNPASWNLTHLASGDLMSGADAIAISNVTWSITPNPPFVNGTMSRITPQLVASGTGNENNTGTMSLLLQNSWFHKIGNYSQTTTFTLFAP